MMNNMAFSVKKSPTGVLQTERCDVDCVDSVKHTGVSILLW